MNSPSAENPALGLWLSSNPDRPDPGTVARLGTCLTEGDSELETLVAGALSRASHRMLALAILEETTADIDFAAANLIYLASGQPSYSGRAAKLVARISNSWLDDNLWNTCWPVVEQEGAGPLLDYAALFDKLGRHDLLVKLIATGKRSTDRHVVEAAVDAQDAYLDTR